MLKRLLIQCMTLVNRDAVQRRNIDGVEHIIISSMTLPDNIVMNGGLYPADEIEKSYKTLERTLAPVEHPTDAQGNFISATDPTAIHNFYAGAFNENVRRENGRVAVDKVINVAEARKTDRGKRLLDRVQELETNENARPIHTSVGVFVDVEQLDAPQTNAQGDTFTWVARNMNFDHDAILLDSVGAAQPHQGVGMAVNADGKHIDVERHLVASAHPSEKPPRPKGAGEFSITADDISVNEMSVDQLRDELRYALGKAVSIGDDDWLYIEDIFADRVIYGVGGDNLFEAQYTLDESGRATIGETSVPVRRVIAYQPRTNQQGDAMRELMLKALQDAGIAVNAEITDAELLAKYNEHLAAQNSGDEPGDGAQPAGGGDAVGEAIANALKPLTDKLGGIEAKLNEREDAERTRMAELVGNSDKFPSIDVEMAKKLDIDVLKAMAADCQPSYGLPLNVNHGEQGAGKSHTYAMPGSTAAN